MNQLQSPIEIERLAAVRRYDILDTPPDGAFDRITRMAARLFNVPIAIVSIVDNDRIWFKSHYGVEAQEIPRSPGLCASAILGDEPWVLTDASQDPRSLANPLVAGEFGLRFYAGVPLHTRDGYNLGTLCVIDHQPREVDEVELAHLRDLAAVVMDELELRLSAKRAVAQREALLHEVHHRIKNNLQVVASLLAVQARSAPADTKHLFEQSVRRVHSMAQLHEQFYREGHLERIDLVSYLRDLVKAILTSYGLGERVTASVDGPCIELGIDRSTPFALLASEVISNSCKHAFPGDRTGTLSIVADQIGDEVTVHIRDDGIGLPSEDDGHHGMGHRLISSFVQQLDGEYRFESDGGTSFILSFPHRPPTTH